MTAELRIRDLVPKDYNLAETEVLYPWIVLFCFQISVSLHLFFFFPIPYRANRIHNSNPSRRS